MIVCSAPPAAAQALFAKRIGPTREALCGEVFSRLKGTGTDHRNARAQPSPTPGTTVLGTGLQTKGARMRPKESRVGTAGTTRSAPSPPQSFCHAREWPTAIALSIFRPTHGLHTAIYHAAECPCLAFSKKRESPLLTTIQDASPRCRNLMTNPQPTPMLEPEAKGPTVRCRRKQTVGPPPETE